MKQKGAHKTKQNQTHIFVIILFFNKIMHIGLLYMKL